MLPEGVLTVSKHLLDDSNAGKDMMDKVYPPIILIQVKKRLKLLLRPGSKASPQFTWPKDQPEPRVVMQRVVELMHFHKSVLDENFRKMGRTTVEKVQARWCCAENPLLFRERWEKLFREFAEADKVYPSNILTQVDPSKISELYDTMKYDALHNRQFLETMFNPGDDASEKTTLVTKSNSEASSGATKDGKGNNTPMLPKLRELYHLAKVLFE